MLFLMDSYETGSDANGNPRILLRVICMKDNEVTNILWEDASYKGIPKNVSTLCEVYDIEYYPGDTLHHVQNHQVDPETWNSLVANCFTTN